MREHAANLVGPLWLGEVARMCRSVVVRYPPQVYAQADKWDHQIEDLIQDVIVSQLIEQGQAAYIAAVATDLAEFRRLLRRTVVRTLSHRRTRTVIDQLLARSRPILGAAPFETTDVGGGTAWHLASRVLPARSLTEPELTAAAIGLRAVPIVAGDGAERAPTIYRTPDLQRLLECLGANLPAPFNTRDLDGVFRRLLTPFLPGSLDSGDATDVASPEHASQTPEERHMIDSAAGEILAALGPEQRLLLAGKLAGVSDADVSHRLGVSRPTAAKRKQEVLELLETTGLDGLQPEQAASVLAELAWALSEVWPTAGGIDSDD